MIRVLVTHTKGGCGKTTIATNLAGAFARGGLRTALADVDRQGSALAWLELRPETAPRIKGLTWRKGVDKVPDSIDRLVIDVPASLRMGEIEELLDEADIVVMPVLPSLFDEASTERFIGRLEELKSIRKGRKGVVTVANRLRPRSKAGQRLEAFLARIEHPPVARIHDRAIYGELAIQGLSVFDVTVRDGKAIHEEWRPLLAAIEAAD